MNLPTELDAALAARRDELRRAGITSIATLNELESQARDRTRKLIDAGIAPARAFEDAIAAQGSPEALRQKFAGLRADRRFSHFYCMWIGLGLITLVIVLASSNLWLTPLPRIRPLGTFFILLGVASLPFLFAYTAYQAAAWRAQSATSPGRPPTLSRVMLWVTAAAGLLWWGSAPDWLLSLLVTYLLISLLMVQAAAIMGRVGYTARLIWPDITACVCILVLVLSAAGTSWPMRLFFLASQDQLDALANRVEAGQTIDAPVWAGTFRIASTEIRPSGWGGGTCLWVFANPGHPTGLIRSDNSLGWGPGTNVNRKIRLSEHWYYVSED